ncbi:MAG TPA: M36 family metallopeptidase [Xanthomonadaceae bacterium]|nr:M36 family metallopeptidase [Xanthomonadaceae bacterium]
MIRSPFLSSSRWRYRSLCLAVSAALVGLTGVAQASQSVNFDVLSSTRPSVPVEAHGASAKLGRAVPGKRDDSRLGLPTFFQAPASLGKRSGPLYLVKDVAALARGYLSDLAPQYKMRAADVDNLETVDIQRLDNGAAIVRFDNRIDGVVVFRERVGVLINADGSLRSVGGSVSGANFANGKSSAAFRMSEEDALQRMMRDMGVAEDLATATLQKSYTQGDYLRFDLANASKSRYRFADPARVRPVYFRLPGGLVPAYYGELQVQDRDTGETRAWSYVVDATWGKLLFRKDLVEQDAFTYRVYGESSAPFTPFVGPQGRDGFPHPTGTPDGYQPASFVTPNDINLQNAPFSRNDPWLPAGATETTGNNVDAYADLDANDGFQGGGADLRAATTTPGNFQYDYNHNLDPLDNGTQSAAAVTNLFYLNNWLHDWFYDSGFDEPAGNAQTDNFGRGGSGGDSIRAEAQDSSGLNNANMSTPADGGRPRMQMYIFTGNGPSQVELTGGVVDTFATGTGSFGPQSFDVTADLVQVDDGAGTTTDGCEPLINALAVDAKIAFVDRGNCNFTVKALNAQNAGAIGMLLADNVAGSVQGMGGTDASVTIPALRITLADGQTIKNAGSTVNARMIREAVINREGSFDSTVVLHEWGHYISNRLVQDSTGLSNQQGRGMGEGWGDFHFLLGLVKEEDAMVPANANFGGVYAGAGYDLGGPSLTLSPNNSHYYGIRRYPYSTDMTKNPLTFAHIENGVPLPVSPPPDFGANGSNNAEVHNAGEVWASALWECYAGLLNDPLLTFNDAQDRMKSYLVGGYKMTPAAPTFLEARDAILSVIASQDEDDYATCLAGFAKRGMGASAVAPDRNDPTNSGVVESGGILSGPQVAISSLAVDVLSCDDDGRLDEGEMGHVVMDVANAGFYTMTGATLTASSTQTEMMFVPDTVNVPALDARTGTSLSIPVAMDGASGSLVFAVNAQINHPDAEGPASFGQSYLGNVDDVPNVSAMADFEVLSPNWSVANEGSVSETWGLVALAADQHRAFGLDAGAPGIVWLESPPLEVSASGEFTMTLDTRYRFEFDTNPNTAWDGGVIEISVDDGANWVDAGPYLSPGYGMALFTGSGNPLAGRQAYVNANASFPNTDTITASFGTAFQGQTVKVRFGVATDAAAGAYGWEIDNVVFSGIDNTPFGVVVPESSVCALSDQIFANGFED